LKLENKKLLIFDLDGTLINSALDLALAVNYMLQRLERDTFSQEVIHDWVGNGALTLVKRALSGDRVINESLQTEYVEKALKIFLDYYANNLCNTTLPYPHVVDTLERVKEKYILSIVTNKPFQFVGPILEGLEMDGLFEYIVGGDSLSKKKPHPMPLLHVCEKFNINIEDAVMIGDSKNDILAANECDMHSVGVTYGYNYGEEIGLHSPTFIINDFTELLELL